jgi:hypothetical protein
MNERFLYCAAFADKIKGGAGENKAEKATEKKPRN